MGKKLTKLVNDFILKLLRRGFDSHHLHNRFAGEWNGYTNHRWFHKPEITGSTPVPASKKMMVLVNNMIFITNGYIEPTKNFYKDLYPKVCALQYIHWTIIKTIVKSI